jgi:hypothetical protein
MKPKCKEVEPEIQNISATVRFILKIAVATSFFSVSIFIPFAGIGEGKTVHFASS